ncbi:MAG TPA: AAA family ATPase [bacterium]|nr:AAA family ATPase [bacterium]
MLTRFEVKNFKNFKDNFVLDFTKTSGYNFNPECVKDGIVNKAIIYGPNAIGKSNLGFAIFDIVSHITDKKKSQELYTDYLNAESDIKLAEFAYYFKFKENVVEYRYGKKSHEELIYEELKINNDLVVYLDRSKNENAKINLKGTETLNKDLSQSKISVVKYIYNSTVLEDNKTNSVFKRFVGFVEKMLYFRSLLIYRYIGYDMGHLDVSKDLLEKSNLKDFENFLNEAGISCKLKEIEQNGEKDIAFDFGKKTLEFFPVASSGTLALSWLYYWLMRFKAGEACSVIFIDEFDAYYHHELSKFVVNTLKGIDCQVILTTHNTSIMSNDLLRPDCYFIMSKENIKPLYDFTDKELREAHNIEKMYRAGAFDG